MYVSMFMIAYSNPAPMERPDAGAGVTEMAAVATCLGMAVFYVAILYSPALILRLPPPNSFESFLARRFVCAAVSSVVSVFLAFLILPVSILFFVPYIFVCNQIFFYELCGWIKFCFFDLTICFCLFYFVGGKLASRWFSFFLGSSVRKGTELNVTTWN